MARISAKARKFLRPLVLVCALYQSITLYLFTDYQQLRNKRTVVAAPAFRPPGKANGRVDIVLGNHSAEERPTRRSDPRRRSGDIQRNEGPTMRGRHRDDVVKHPWEAYLQGTLEEERRGGFVNTSILASADDEPDARLRSPRTMILYNHNPKAGGSYIKYMLSSLVRPGSFNLRRETKSSEPRDRELAFVLGSVREPCAHLLSLWSFGSMGVGGNRRRMSKNLGKNVTEFLYRDRRFAVDDPVNVSRFRAWVRHPGMRGFLTARFIHSYTARPNVDCFVRIGSGDQAPTLELKRCLQRFFDEANRIKPSTDDDDPLSKFDEADQKSKDSRNSAPHGSCELYYDDEVAALVKRHERPLYDAFGWEKCCAEQALRDMPPKASEAA